MHFLIHEFFVLKNLGVLIPPYLIRKAILEARRYIDDERPLSTTRFRTDGRTIFLEVVDGDSDPKLLDLFKRQYTFKRIVEASLKGVEFDDGVPVRWWPLSKQDQIVIDPERSFGQPIESTSGVPTASLAAAARAEGSVERAAKLWRVTPRAVRRAVKFEETFIGAA